MTAQNWRRYLFEEIVVSLSLSGGPVGAITATCSAATDNADNTGAAASVTYNVIYPWTGFFAPVDNLPTLNIAKAGSAIPVKFSLGGDQGLGILATGYPKVVVITCDTNTPTDVIESTVTPGQSTLTYDATAGQYIYVWKTDKAWAGTCRQLQVKLVDGTTHVARGSRGVRRSLPRGSAGPLPRRRRR
jgi:hypothetical protein